MNLYVDIPRAPELALRLTRWQIAQRVGAGANDYPRPGGVLVPQPLSTLCRSLPASTDEDRRRSGRELVLSVARALQRLPAQLLNLEMPHPKTVLGTLPIEARTRAVIDRLLPILAKEPAWTVRRYLGIPKFGPRCLVDLLAACEEKQRGAALPEGPRGSGRAGEAGGAIVPFTPIDLGRLDDIARLLGNLLPISTSELAQVLVREGLASAPVTLEHLAEVYRRMELAAPFRVLTHGGMAIAVGRDNHGFAATVAATAVRLVSQWGLSTVDSVVERVGVLRSAPTSRSFVCRLLVALPRLRWLDQAMEWFSFLDDRSPLARRIAKVFSVARRVPLRDLRRALDKGQARGPRTPPEVLARYLSDVGRCQVDGGQVVGTAPIAAATLSREEAILVSLLERARCDLDVDELTRAAEARALPRARVLRLLRDSPLFVRGPGRRVGLVGQPQRH